MPNISTPLVLYGFISHGHALRLSSDHSALRSRWALRRSSTWIVHPGNLLVSVMLGNPQTWLTLKPEGPEGLHVSRVYVVCTTEMVSITLATR